MLYYGNAQYAVWLRHDELRRCSEHPSFYSPVWNCPIRWHVPTVWVEGILYELDWFCWQVSGDFGENTGFRVCCFKLTLAPLDSTVLHREDWTSSYDIRPLYYQFRGSNR